MVSFCPKFTQTHYLYSYLAAGPARSCSAAGRPRAASPRHSRAVRPSAALRRTAAGRCAPQRGTPPRRSRALCALAWPRRAAASGSGGGVVRRTPRSFQSGNRRSLRRAEVRAESLYRQCACPAWEAHSCRGTTPLLAEVAAAFRTHRDTLAATEAAAAVLEQAELPPRRQLHRRSRSRSPPRHPAPPEERVYFLHHLPKPPPPPGRRKEETTKSETTMSETTTRNAGNSTARDSFESARTSET